MHLCVCVMPRATHFASDVRTRRGFCQGILSLTEIETQNSLMYSDWFLVTIKTHTETFAPAYLTVIASAPLPPMVTNNHCVNPLVTRTHTC